jgi:UDP:flavonoid glycosyltransferase YjiC (YdhE family)
VPLGQGLHSAGHRVRIATFKEFAPLILNAGLDFYPLQGDARELLNTAVNSGLLSGRSNPLSFMRGIKRSYSSLAATLADDLSDQVLHDSELILNQLPAYLFGGDLAEFLGVPWAIVSVIPLTRTRYRPLIGFPSAFSFVPGYNAITYRLGEQMAWGIFRQTVNRWRSDVLGLPAKSYFGDFEGIFRQKVPVLNGFSSHVVPRPPDWGEQIHVTGWWHPTDPSWEPSKRLRQFIEDGDRPIFIGFGSVPVSDSERVTSTIVEAVRLVGRKAILHAGWAGLGDALPDEILPIKYAPYDWLFPRMAAVVHHGGSGTSGFAFKSGVPSLTIPFGFDQYYWGERATALGVGPQYLPFRKLDSAVLAERIQIAISDDEMALQARKLSRKLGAENGVAKAVEIILRLTGDGAG